MKSMALSRLVFSGPRSWSLVAGAFALIFTTSFVSAESVSFTPTDLQDIRALARDGDTESETDLVTAVYRIRKQYQVPISIELPPEIGGVLEPPLGIGALATLPMRFAIEKNESLLHALNKLQEESEGVVQWQIIHGQICILPTKESAEDLRTHLDVPVSLSIDGGSVWDAIKAIGKQINSKYPRVLVVRPDEWLFVQKPLAALTGEREISLVLENVSAREAICAVFAASSLPMAYEYLNGTNDGTKGRERGTLAGLDIVAYENGQPRSTDDLLEPEDVEWWRKEIDEVIQAFREVNDLR